MCFSLPTTEWLPQEMVTGNEFYIDLRLKTDFKHAAVILDELDDTISYADIYAILKQEMEIPSKLLEHVCGRIATRLFSRVSGIEEIEIKLSKEIPNGSRH